MSARPTVTIVHLYPDLLMSYGDRGNVLVLERRAGWRGIDVRIVPVHVGEPLPPGTDLVVIGGGSDRVQRLIGDDLAARRPELAERVADGTAVFGVCAGYQLLGRSYASAEGHDIEGLGLLDLETKAGTGRIIGRVHGKATLEGRAFDLVGFENHGGRTTLGPGATPLATVARGRGNDGRDRTEGAIEGRVVGTYLHGPVLPTAPDLADVLLSWALAHAGAPGAAIVHHMGSSADEQALETLGVESDLRRLLAVQAIRAFLYGFGTVVLGTALVNRGFSTVEVGLLFTMMLAGMAITAVLVGLVGDRIGRRRAYTALLALMGLVGAGFAFTGNVWLLMAMALTGVMSTDANESGPITTLEQAMIGQAPPDVRLHVFGRYNAVAYLAGALGALAAGGPAFLHRVWHAAPTAQTWLLVFPVGAVVCLAIVRGLSDRIELRRADGAPRRALERSRSSVFTLAGLFAVDSFAGGFVVTAFLVVWFEQRYGASLEVMSLVIFAAGLLQAVSSIVATRVARRFGLLHTMVFTHLPSNVLLILVPLMPTLGTAVAVLLARFALSQMDVPTRQAYVAAMVDAEERTAAAAATNTARYVSRPLGPLVGAALTQHVAVAAPFVAAGTLKSVYDLVLFRVFRRVPLPDA